MTPAQEGITALAEWVRASSPTVAAPNGRDYIVRGAYAILIPQALGLPPTPSDFDSRHLPLWISEQQAPPGLAPWGVPAPENQDRAAARLAHLVFLAADRVLRLRVVGLSAPEQTIQAALSAQAPGLDLDAVAVVFAPLWGLPPEDRLRIEAQLPHTGASP